MRSQYVGGGDGFCARDLQVVEIYLCLFALRDGSRRCEQAWVFPNGQNRKKLGKRPHLLVGINRFERDVDVHAIAARGFWMALAAQRVQFLLDDLRRLDNLGIWAVFSRSEI